MLKTLGKLQDRRDRIGAWFAALAAIVGGLVLIAGPEEITREIGPHREIGFGALAFGLLTVLALCLRGSAGYRARSALLCAVAVLLGGGLGWWGQSAVRDVWALHEHGELRSVPVVGTTVRRNPKTREVTRLTQVSIDGARVSLDLGRFLRRGELVEVLVPNERPNAAVPGTVPREWLPLIDAVIGRWTGLIVLAAFLGCLLAAPVSLWNTLVGPRAGSTEPGEGRRVQKVSPHVNP